MQAYSSKVGIKYYVITGKSLSEALIYMTTDCSLNYEFSTWKLQAQNMLCTSFVFCSEQFMYTTCSELAIFMYWTCNSMNNLLSYWASEKDLPVDS